MNLRAARDDAVPGERRRGRPVDPEAREAKARRILGAARRCALRKGFHAASTAEISAEAGISVAGLYQAFPSKDDLILAVAEDDLAMDLALVRAIAEAPSFLHGLDRLLHADRAGTGHADYARLRLDMLAEATRNPRVAAAMRRVEDTMTAALAEAVAAAQARGELVADRPAEAIAGALLAIAEGYYARTAAGIADPGAMASTLAAVIARAFVPAAPDTIPADQPGTDP